MTGENVLQVLLKAKGLERDIVILVSSAPTDKRILFQLFMGASRAKAKVMMLVQKAILMTYGS